MQARHVKRPMDPASYIPIRCQTLCAPAAYCVHGDGVGAAWADCLMGENAPFVDWGAVAHGSAVLRIPGTDAAVQLLADPQVKRPRAREP